MSLPAAMDFFNDVLQLEFLRRAVMAGLLISTMCSLLSLYVVYQRLAFIGQGISHASFGGLALGLLLTGATVPDARVYAITALFAVLVAALITEVSRASRLSEDTAIGIFFAVSMALGIVLLAFRSNYTAQAFSYLFGSILAVTRTDLYLLLALAGLVGLLVMVFYKELFALSFDEEMAAITGVPVRFMRHLLLGVLALVIVLSMKLIGAVLVSAFLVIPGATAALFGGRFPRLMAAAVMLGIFATLLGLYLSYCFNLPSGATIVLCQFVLFLLGWTVAPKH